MRSNIDEIVVSDVMNTIEFYVQALSHSHGKHLSSALFAPGWLYETLDQNDFIDNDQK